MRPLPRCRAVIVSAALSVCLLDLPPAVGEGTAASSGAGQGLKQLGRRVGKAGGEAGREVADAARMIWYKGKRVARPLLEDVQEATRKFWAEVIEGKDRMLKDLRRENESLKRRLAEKEGR